MRQRPIQKVRLKTGSRKLDDTPTSLTNSVRSNGSRLSGSLLHVFLGCCLTFFSTLEKIILKFVLELLSTEECDILAHFI